MENNKSFNGLVIVGDSFCAKREKQTDWPVALAKLLKCTVTGNGHSGQSWWTTRYKLEELSHDKSSNILIVVHTESARLPNDHEIPINTGQLFVDRNQPINELTDWPDAREVARSFYLSDLFCENFYRWAQQAWIKELDADTEYYATIHIPAFDSVDLSCVKNGIRVIPSPSLRSLRALSDREIGKTNWVGIDSRSNHLTDTNNVNLAKALASIILKLQPGDTGERNFDNLHEWDFNVSKTDVVTFGSLDFKDL